MQIKDIKFHSLALLAPMAGSGDLAFRKLCSDFGAGYTVSEMVSSKGLVMGDRKSHQLMELGGLHPSGIQIFGDEPEIMAEAAKKCLPFNPDIIDINMGCPAPKVASNGGGASLMKNPSLSGEIIKAVVNAVNIPVTVKIRKGWDKDSINAVKMAQTAEINGAAAITIHGRTKEEMYRGKADLSIIKSVKQSVSIPVIGNGDIVDIYSAANMIEETNCDGIMIGRGALGNPWIFQQINAYFGEGTIIPPPSLTEKMTVMLRHIKDTINLKGEHTAMLEARHHAAYYTKGIRGGAAIRKEISTLQTYEQLQELVVRIVKEHQNDF